MITSYILILCVSTWLLVAGVSQAAKRLVKLLGPAAKIPLALCVMLPIIGFLVVVAAAPAMLVGALVLVVVGVAVGVDAASVLVRFGVPAFAALLAASSIHFPQIEKMPAAVVMLGALMALTAMVLAAEHAPVRLSDAAMGTIAALLPLLAAPFMGAPSYIALDVALIASGLLAALMVLPSSTALAALRAPFALIAGWLIIESAVAGAWVPAVLSVAAYGATIAYGLMRNHEQTEIYAL